ncbi:Dolichyl-phosphate-mannose--protein mannosyltransferase 4 [Sporothrix epigloea]|uniref:Dolichyl-phosphate-mannose--protein mannosyltransferase 4 n=1 Tax=Sporothrix epigloea TaxID=1892477 RepID=A0ABP0E3N8_9PEZI
MTGSSTTQASLRHRNVSGSGKKENGTSSDSYIDAISPYPVKAAGPLREHQINAVFDTVQDINHPDKAVYDEVHIGKFASYYL